MAIFFSIWEHIGSMESWSNFVTQHHLSSAVANIIIHMLDDYRNHIKHTLLFCQRYSRVQRHQIVHISSNYLCVILIERSPLWRWMMWKHSRRPRKTHTISLEWHGIFVVSVFRIGFKEICHIIDVDEHHANQYDWHIIYEIFNTYVRFWLRIDVHILYTVYNVD